MKTSSVPYKENAIKLSELRADATENVSTEILKERLRQFRREVVLDIDYTILDYTFLSDESDRVEGSITQLARPDAWISRVVTFRIERERQGGP